MLKRWAALTAAGSMAFAAVTVAAPREAQAQMDPCVMGTVCRTNALPQGTIGGSLLGIELVMLIEGAAGLRNPWIMLGTGLAGGIGGGIGGYFLDQALDATGQPQGMTAISTGMLVVGLGLVIPTAIVFVGSTMYRPPETAEQGRDDAQNVPLEEGGGSSAPAAGGASGSGGSGGGASGGSSAPPAGGAGATSTGTGAPTSSLRPRRARALVGGRAWVPSPSLLSFSTERGLSLGVPSVGLVSSRDRSQPDGAVQSEWRVSLLSGTF